MIKDKSITFTVEEAQNRVDKVASKFIPRQTFTREDTEILVNNKKAKKSSKVKIGDNVTINYTEELFEGVVPKDIPLDVLYEDDDILVINKESGMVVHPGSGNWENTLVNALLFRYGTEFNTSDDEDEEDTNNIRPGIVHRLDKDTSGVLVVAKTADAHRNLAEQFQNRETEKFYIAVVKGFFPKRRGTIEQNIKRSDKNRKLFTTTEKRTEGRSAITHYTVLKQFEGYAFVKIKIDTGRTHQIRVHMTSINHPVLGDSLYSREDKNIKCDLQLHSLSLKFLHPTTNEEMIIYAPLPKRIKDVVYSLKLNSKGF